MCGIVGYTGRRRAVPIIIEGLRRLEYRGYDSAGVAGIIDDGAEIFRQRARGKLARLEEILEEQDIRSHTGLGHTRWATHGAPSEDNAHPHCDCSGDLVVVHNGIIENYRSLKEELHDAGHCFTSETDTEVLAHLFEDELKKDHDLACAVRHGLARVEGAFAIAVLWKGAPDTLVAARRHSPLVLGVSDSGNHLASDIPALLPYTRQVIFLNDDEMAVLTPDSHKLLTLAGERFERETSTVDWNAAMAEKAGFKHFMLKEIYEQPEAVSNTIRGRIDPESGRVNLPETGLDEEKAAAISRITLLACGTSWHAALIARYWIEKWCRIPVDVDIASEFRYRSLLIDSSSLVIPISQSGETADTLAGMRRARKLGAGILAICNVVGSTMTREADATVYTHAGPEIGVASTKAFTSQLAALFLITLHLGQLKGTIPSERARELAAHLTAIPFLMKEELRDLSKRTAPLAEEFNKARDFIYLGRGINFPVALEGALKLKEISYIHAEGYPAGELKHGPIALVDPEMPILALLPRDSVYEKTLSNAEEVKARKGRLIVVGTAGDEKALGEMSEHLLVVPATAEDLYPLILSLPLQMLAYQIANLRGCDVDQPRNLAKSVTVE